MTNAIGQNLIDKLNMEQENAGERVGTEEMDQDMSSSNKGTPRVDENF